jgi:hypothetical protein
LLAEVLVAGKLTQKSDLSTNQKLVDEHDIVDYLIDGCRLLIRAANAAEVCGVACALEVVFR